MAILRERHRADCTCSICRSLEHAAPYSFGFLAPADKVWNAWRWLFLVTPTGVRYLRWSGFWQRHSKEVA